MGIVFDLKRPSIFSSECSSTHKKCRRFGKMWENRGRSSPCIRCRAYDAYRNRRQLDPDTARLQWDFSFPSWYGEPRLVWDPGWIVPSLSPFLFGTGWHEFIVCGGSNTSFLYQIDSDVNPLQTGYPEGFAWTTLIYLTCGSNWESGTFNINNMAMPDSSFCGTAGSCFKRWSLVMLLLCGYCVYFYCVGSSSGGGRA